MENFGSMP